MYITTCNTPGFMPDDEPQQWDTFDAAKRGLIAQILHDADDYGTCGEDDLADELAGVAEDVNLWSEPGSVSVPRGGELLPIAYEIQKV